MKHDETQAIQGVLWSSRGPWVTLREADFLKEGKNPSHIDGEAIVHRSNIAFLQVLP
jgi:hypothetical protein